MIQVLDGAFGVTDVLMTTIRSYHRGDAAGLPRQRPASAGPGRSNAASADRLIIHRMSTRHVN
jgi:glyceraldehyde-3-phosphate dehydrogenase/erythrose-4-phosphate dehydrogenase